MAAAQQLAEQSNHAQIEPEHLLVALVEQREGVVPELLRKMNADPAAVARAARELGQDAAGLRRRAAGPLAAAQAVADLAEAEAQRLKDEYVSTEHLLVAIASETGRSPSANLLTDAASPATRSSKRLTGVRGSQRVTSQIPEGTYQALERYGRDLTELARKGKLDPVIGRDEEIRRVVQVLSRRTKNNPCSSASPASARRPLSKASQPHRSRRRPGGPEEQADRRPRYGSAGRRRQIPRRVRGTAEGGAEGNRRRRRAVVLFIDELHTVVGAVPPKDRSTRPTC